MTREKKLLLILAVVFFLVFTMPKVVDMYRSAVAKKVVTRWRDTAAKYAAYWNVDAKVLLAIICQESSGNPDSVNPADPSRGLMQVTPGALADFNRIVGRSYTFEQMFDPNLNVEVGTWYYATRLRSTKQQHTALAAYNAGLGNVQAGLGYADKVEAYKKFVEEHYGSL